ncbi:MAG: MATE family efflux transporter [Frankiales bacterium]|nr:MAG: MATE family efflux transporter [Frankiales bacterium]
MSARAARRATDREILRLAVPAFGALVAEPLFLLADSAIVGRLGTAPLAGLGIAGSVLASAIGIFVFLAYGTTAAVARRVGAGDLRSAVEDGIDGMWLALLIGVGTAALAFALAPQVVGVFDPSAVVAEQAVTYLRWSLPGLPAMLVVLAATGILRGLQDTRTPLAVAAAGAAANVVLSVALVHGAGMGIAGSALGTVIAQLGMAAAFLVVVGRAARRTSASLAPDVPGVVRVARAGVPLLVRTLTLRAALLVTTYVAVAQGDAELAAHQVATVLWGFLALALDAVAIAGQALTGRALGAGDAAGARAATRRMVLWGTGAGVLLGGLVLALRGPLAPLFSPEVEVQGALVAVLVVVAVTQPLAGYVFVLDGVLIGAGDGRYLARAGLVTLAAYLPLVALVLWSPLSGTAGLVWLWIAFAGGFMLARAVTLGLRLRSGEWLVLGAVRGATGR